MLSLLFSICLLANPTNCHQHKLIFSEESVTVTQCAMGVAGQEEMARELQRYPGSFIARWTCKPVSEFAKA